MDRIEKGFGYLVWQRVPIEHIPVTMSETDLMRDMENVIDQLIWRKVGLLRTGVSWVEWENAIGKKLISWFVHECHQTGINILPNLTYTPPHISREGTTNSPPKNLADYAVFVREICEELGECFEYVELWNEPNLITDWNGSPEEFAEMIRLGGKTAHEHGKKVVLGGIAGIRPQSLAFMKKVVDAGAMQHVDIVGFHALRGTWSDTVPPPSLDEQAKTLGKLTGAPVWLTEYGFPTANTEGTGDIHFHEEIQVAIWADAIRQLKDGLLERVYMYTLRDKVAPSVRFHTTGWEDILQYYYGDSREDGTPKLVGKLMLEGGPEHVLKYAEEHKLWHLVDKASLNRTLLPGYKSQDSSQH